MQVESQKSMIVRVLLLIAGDNCQNAKSFAFLQV